MLRKRIAGQESAKQTQQTLFHDKLINELVKHERDKGVISSILFTQKPCIGLSHFPSPALPGSGSMGMISARNVGAPLMIDAKLDQGMVKTKWDLALYSLAFLPLSYRLKNIIANALTLSSSGD
ncbi:hypothetical protein ADIS_4332 [Lunatimonas lonarensis]|uniref:Uncharacterized protein n=1 Tax=Lunatimonas lonarensis TaxID=1232681 RepID=R7ZM34_9BACT|nr:hypothetical protein ADIS_4332 [Lunatimonas lonarensis]